MSVEEMRKQIIEKINVLDDEQALQQVLQFLNSEQDSALSIDPTKYLNQLFQENDGLLKRLS